MTAHRALSPVTAEFSGVGRGDLCTASGLHGMRQQHQAHPSPAVGHPGHPAVLPAVSCTLSPHPESVKAGRDFTRATLCGWGMATLTDVAELVVSELVTNALRHGAPAIRPQADGPDVRLRLLAQSPFVMCMVTDGGSNIPVLRESGPAAESGRGLQVVESCCVRWGWHLLDEGGKVVWAVLRPTA